MTVHLSIYPFTSSTSTMSASTTSVHLSTMSVSWPFSASPMPVHLSTLSAHLHFLPLCNVSKCRVYTPIYHSCLPSLLQHLSTKSVYGVPTISTHLKNRSLLQKSPTKETIFCKKRPIISRSQRIVATPYLHFLHIRNDRIPRCRESKCTHIRSKDGYDHTISVFFWQHTEISNLKRFEQIELPAEQTASINLNKTSSGSPRSASNQSSKPCTALQYPSRKDIGLFLMKESKQNQSNPATARVTSMQYKHLQM